MIKKMEVFEIRKQPFHLFSFKEIAKNTKFFYQRLENPIDSLFDFSRIKAKEFVGYNEITKSPYLNMNQVYNISGHIAEDGKLVAYLVEGIDEIGFIRGLFDIVYDYEN